MTKSRKEVDRVIADLDAKIEALMSARNLIIASKIAATHTKAKTPKESKARPTPKEAA